MKLNHKNVNKIIAVRLRKIRRNFGYSSASKFAEKHDIPVQTYLNHESGKRGIDIATLLHYADLLGVEYTDIIGDAEALLKSARSA